MERPVAYVLPALLLLACGGPPPELACPASHLPSPDPSYAQTLEGLEVVPARAALRGASAAELETFERFVAERQVECEASPPAAGCELASLRAGLRALPAPDHANLFTGIDDDLTASLDRAHADFPTLRDCGADAEAVCDARVTTTAFARSLCDLRPEGEHE